MKILPNNFNLGIAAPPFRWQKCMMIWCLALGMWFQAGCAVGPHYHRPPVAAPATFRSEQNSSTNSFGDLSWQEVFTDDTLRGLIGKALTNNYDLRIAVTRVEQAQAMVAESRAGFFPQVNYGAAAGSGRNVSGQSTPSPTGTGGSVFAADANASWEIDLWGRIRRLNESARAQFFASQEDRRNVMISLIGQVAQSYFQLLALDRQLEIARESTNSFGQSLYIFTERLRGGVASKLETSSAEALMDSAAATIPQLEQQIALQENQLSVLLGENPRAIGREQSALTNETLPEIPAGLPSALLERRPDIRTAEQQLRSANAEVGVAVADFFPQLDLTGLFGEVSTHLSTFLSGGGDIAWSAAAGLTGPLFHGGQLRAQYAQARAVREQTALQYQSTILNSFAELSNDLVARQKFAETRSHQNDAVTAYQEAVKIAMQRYRQGNADYYEVLQEQQLLFPAENSLAQTQLNQLLATVQLYSALGGGWNKTATDH